MAESQLSLSLTDFCRTVGRYLGWGRDDIVTPTVWSTDQQAILLEICNAAYRQVLRAHDWNFMEPTTSLDVWPDIAVSTTTITATDVANSVVTASAATFYESMIGSSLSVTDGSTYTITAYTSSTVIIIDGNANSECGAGATFTIDSPDYVFPLPADFGGIVGPMTFEPNEGFAGVSVVGEGKIRNLRQRGDTTGRPQFVAIRPKTCASGTVGQRYEALFWPDPDSHYSLSFKYRKLIDDLDTTNIYPVGGMQHSELFMAACLAVAELRENDIHGEHNAEYQRQLTQSIRKDQTDTTPEYFGTLHDYSEDAGKYSRQTNYVTYGGEAAS